MTFPLQPGCRKVCHPARNPPRVVRRQDVMRFARAAVKHGEDPCNLSKAIRRALGCCCDDVLASIDSGIQAIKEDWDRILEIVGGIGELLGIVIELPKVGKPLPNGVAVTFEPGIVAILKRLWTGLRAGVVVAALLELLYAVGDMLNDIGVLIDDIGRLVKCCSCEEEGNETTGGGL